MNTAILKNSVALVKKRTIPTEQRRLSAKLVPTVVDIGCRVVSSTDYYGRLSRFSRLRVSTFQLKYLLICTPKAEWTPFQNHYFLENLVAPGIETGTSGSVARSSDH
jgi:hypothetical protein